MSEKFILTKHIFWAENEFLTSEIWIEKIGKMKFVIRAAILVKSPKLGPMGSKSPHSPYRREIKKKTTGKIVGECANKYHHSFWL